MKFPVPLWDAMRQRAKDLGYSTTVGYIVGLIRYDLICQKPHEVTRHIGDLPLATQDDVDAGLLRITKTGEGQKGSFLRKLVEEIIDAENSNLPVEQVTSGITGKIIAFARKK
jgi:hypothetical protein